MMNKFLWMTLTLFLLTSCGGLPMPTAGNASSLATPRLERSAAPLATPSPISTGTPTADPYLYLHGTETAIALNQAALEQQAAQIKNQQAALDMQMTVDAATAQAGYTATAIVKADAISTRSVQTQAAGSATAMIPTYAAGTQQAKLDEQKYRSDVAGMWIGKSFLLCFTIIVLGALGYGAWRAIKIAEFKQSQMRPDEHGRLPAVPEDTIPGTQKRIVNVNLSHRAVTGRDTDDLAAEQALQNAASQRGLEATRVVALAYAQARKAPPMPGNGVGSDAGVQIEKANQPLLEESFLPEWSEWMKRWTPGKIALGVNEKGLILTDPILNPHFLISGTTGSGKTRYGLRTLIACALASGWQVVIAGKELDFQIFKAHPNVHMLTFSLLSEPTRAVDLLRNVYNEIERRDHLLSSRQMSLWSQTSLPQTMVVMDEFSNLADALEDVDRSKREELWRWARMDTAEARKYGLHMVYALQDPTARSIDLRIRRNTTPIVFRVKDADSSRTVLATNGAEALPERHFMTVISNLVRGAAFAPTDDDISSFLAAYPVKHVERPDWIDAEVKDVAAEEPAADDAGRDFEIWTMHMDGKSMNEIQRTVFGRTGGAFYQTVRDVIERYKKASTNSTTTRNMPSTGPLAA